MYTPAPRLGFVEAVRLAFQRSFQLTGRSRRSEYWWFALFTALVTLVLTTLDLTVLGRSTSQIGTSDVFGWLVFIPQTTLLVRRLHDVGRSGWWALLQVASLVYVLVPSDVLPPLVRGLVGLLSLFMAVLFLVWTVSDSDVGTNAHGPSPKYGDRPLVAPFPGPRQ